MIWIMVLTQKYFLMHINYHALDIKKVYKFY